mgnify:CR=1 FL=1
MKKLVVTLVAVGTAAAMLAVPALAGTANIKVGDNYFVRPGSTPTVTVRAGTTLRWVWAGRKPHNVVGSGFRSPTKTSGTYSRKFSGKGSFRVICTVHSSMKMTVRVV